MDERIVCRVIVDYILNLEREKEEEKGKKKRAVPHYRKNVEGSRDDVLTKGGYFDD